MVADGEVKKANTVVIPRRQPSVVIPPRLPRYTTPDKTTCVDCGCYIDDEPYEIPALKKLRPCQRSPPTLYELASRVVDRAPPPEPTTWRTNDVARWIAEDVGLPQYQDCFLANNVDGFRLLMFEDPSRLPLINIRDCQHIMKISEHIRKLYSVDDVLFARSVGLPPRRPGTHTTMFKARTGPNWGVRVNWSRTDILRWMKIINPKPYIIDHWDAVWYLKPDFPKTLLARVPPHAPIRDHIPHYVKPKDDICWEYQVPRKFRLLDLTESNQKIWMERRKGSIAQMNREALEKAKRLKMVAKKQRDTRLYPKPISLEGLHGKDFILARRLMPKVKFQK